MKKFLLTLAAAFVVSAASAQVVTSYSYAKSKKATTWYARIGLSLNNVAGANEIVKDAYDDPEDGKASLGSRAGMDIDFGFQRPISNFGLYWGMELGFGTRGASMKEEWYGDRYNDGETVKSHISTWNVKYSPFTFGYKYSVTDDIKIDAHIGAYLSYDFSGKAKSDYNDGEKSELTLSQLKDEADFQCFDAGMQIGVGVWWKRYNLDFTYQRGFVAASNIYEYYDSKQYDLYSSNFMIRLGVAF